ncbi:AAA family ATPase [Nocardia nova]|uniref:AAA family ATPase n=1 Tax=Nocardia nova TaxID=37330 RepID=UPI00273A258F|nr:AAA family ATPase [Nocardia nova]
MDIEFQKYTIRGLDRINVLLGKNGCGKSTVLKQLQNAVASSGKWASARYITPERGGVLSYNPSVEHNILNDATWLRSSRSVNQFTQFKEQTVTQYRQLELSVLRTVEIASKAGTTPKSYFSDYLERINGLLDNIEIRSIGTDNSFKLHDRESGAELSPKDISSGESELIALAIESLVFVQGVSKDTRGLLILDEPDVHLHPDLQARLVSFLAKLIDEFEFDIIMATHSTPILGELASSGEAKVCPMTARQTELTFESVDDIYQQLLPVFGAHPLTRVFSNSPTLLVEGEDDVRIWQQAVRSSNKRIQVYPVECGGLPLMAKYENRLVSIMNAVYDGATAYSLRDRDDKAENLDDMPPVKRMRLSCRAAENLLLSDEVLADLGVTWQMVSERINEWISVNAGHPKYDDMKEFAEQGFPRKVADLKNIRMILAGQILASNKPWEVIVGQAIGSLAQRKIKSVSEHSLASYLGEEVMKNLLSA